MLYFLNKSYDDAIKAYDEAIRLDPNDADTRNNKGLALEFQGRYDEAIQAYDEAIKIDPSYETARYNKATLWMTKAMRNQSG
jgi:tetratricopeptide (TPR) repeat protein